MELATVKKGTPLYGQPSWWGEDEQEGQAAATGTNTAKKEVEKKRSTGRSPRPSSLSLSSDGSPSTETAPCMDRASHKDWAPPASHGGPQCASATYMEIPVHDDNEGEASPDGWDNSRETITPALSTVSSSLSKDSLFSPDVRQPSKNDNNVSPGSEVNTATSFTIDLEEHAPHKKININASLSEFVPSKMRRNFRERKEWSTGSRTGSKESTPSKNSEERELSPSLKKKVEEIWSGAEGKGKPARLSSVQSTMATSLLRSPNLEDIDRLSELSEERRSSERETERKGKQRQMPGKSPQMSRSTKTRRAPSSSSATSASSASSPKAKRAAPDPTTSTTSSVNVSQYADPTSYLIDKMFEGGTARTTTSVSSTSSSIPSPEHIIYKESIAYDKPVGAVAVVVATAKSADNSSKVMIKSTAAAGKSGHVKTPFNAKMNRDAKLKKYLQLVSPCRLVPDDDEENDDVRGGDKVEDNANEDDDLQITETVPERKDDKEKDDKASEAGTYTIEADGKEKEEEEARKRIDQVFGVDVDSFVDTANIDPHRLDSPGGYDNVYDEYDDLDEVDTDCDDSTPMDHNNRYPSVDDDDDDDIIDIDDLKVDNIHEVPIDDGEGTGMAATTEGGVQTWVSQLTALTSQKMAKEEDGYSLSKKPPQGLNRKRPGTGRKLPSIPNTDRSPVSSEHSSYLGDQAELFVADGTHSPSTQASASHLVNGKKSTSVSARTSVNGKAVPISSQSGRHRGGKSNGHSVEDTESSVGSPHLSTRSRGSEDTELLLQDTETVMAAMEARMAYKSGHGDRQSSSGADGGHSDTDVSSTVALVNGDDNYVKRTLFKSPRDALSKRQQRTDLTTLSKNGVSSPASTSSSGKKSIGRSYSKTVAPKAGSVESPRSVTSVTSTGGTRRTIVSDVFSRRDSLDNDSVISDVSSETGPGGSFSRSGSKAKGTITMTKPNRAFQLRRARAESVDEPPVTPRSARSTASSKYSMSGASARSSSVHNTGRTRSAADTRHSDTTATSLGGQIVRKSHQNSTQEKAKASPNLSRLDGARHSLRLPRASSLTLSQANMSQAAPASKRELGIKSTIRPTGSRGNLCITGKGSSASRSQPGSRSNSPKAAERMAWKRRKEYDPRKAVAEAKAKSKDTTCVTARPKPSASSSYKRRMIRSASFTNPQELALSVQNSLSSSSRDFSMASTLNGNHYYSDGLRRAFHPFQNSLRTERSAHSADEDDSILSNNSGQASYDTLIVSSVYQLSLKLKTSMDKTLNKLREQDRVSLTPSPIDDFLSDSGRCEIPAWKSANQELTGVLKNLRKIERHVQMMNRALFPEEDTDTEVGTGMRTGQEKQRYFQEIERIRNEIKGFQPIEPCDSEVASPEMAELSEQF